MHRDVDVRPQVGPREEDAARVAVGGEVTWKKEEGREREREREREKEWETRVCGVSIDE